MSVTAKQLDQLDRIEASLDMLGIEHGDLTDQGELDRIEAILTDMSTQEQVFEPLT